MAWSGLRARIVLSSHARRLTKTLHVRGGKSRRDEKQTVKRNINVHNGGKRKRKRNSTELDQTGSQTGSEGRSGNKVLYYRIIMSLNCV